MGWVRTAVFMIGRWHGNGELKRLQQPPRHSYIFLVESRSCAARGGRHIFGIRVKVNRSDDHSLSVASLPSFSVLDLLARNDSQAAMRLDTQTNPQSPVCF